MFSCNICAEDFKEELREVCDCGFKCCAKCVYMYINSLEHHKEPSCMNCGEYFSIDKLKKDNIISNTIFKKLSNRILDKHVMLKEEQYMYATKLKICVNRRKEILNKEKKLLEEELGVEVISVMNDKISKISTNNFKQCKKECGWYTFRDYGRDTSDCDRCYRKICNYCEEELSDIKHICNDKTVKSLEIINNDSVPCPTCGVSIYKAAGCNQMMCSECFTFFDYSTGDKDKDKTRHAADFHSKYLEFKEKVVSADILKEAEENHFAYLMDLWSMPKHDYYIKHVSPTVIETLAISINSITFVKNSLVDYLNEKMINETARISYLNGDITKKQFRRECVDNFKTLKNRKYILSILTNVLTLYRIILNKYAKKCNSISNSNMLSSDKKKQYQEEAMIFSASVESVKDKYLKDDKIYGYLMEGANFTSMIDMVKFKNMIKQDTF